MFKVPPFHRPIEPASLGYNSKLFLKNNDEALKQVLLQKAFLLKNKIFAETNSFDHDVNQLMKRTLKELQDERVMYRAKTKYRKMIENPILENQQLLKREKFIKSDKDIIENVQTSYRNFKKNFNRIQTKKRRVYTYNYPLPQKQPNINPQDSKNPHTISEMLLTMKQKLKKQNTTRRTNTSQYHSDSNVAGNSINNSACIKFTTLHSQKFRKIFLKSKRQLTERHLQEMSPYHCPTTANHSEVRTRPNKSLFLPVNQNSLSSSHSGIPSINTSLQRLPKQSKQLKRINQDSQRKLQKPRHTKKVSYLIQGSSRSDRTERQFMPLGNIERKPTNDQLLKMVKQQLNRIQQKGEPNIPHHDVQPVNIQIKLYSPSQLQLQQLREKKVLKH